MALRAFAAALGRAPAGRQLRRASVLPGVAGAAVDTTGKPLVQHTDPTPVHPQLRRILEGTPHQQQLRPRRLPPSSAMKARWSLSEIDRMMVEANRVLTALRHEKAIKDTSSAAAAAAVASRTSKTRKGARLRGRRTRRRAFGANR